MDAEEAPKDVMTEKTTEKDKKVEVEKTEGSNAADQANVSTAKSEEEKPSTEPSAAKGSEEEKKDGSAHQQDREGQPSSRVKQGQRWNDRDRTKHSHHSNGPQKNFKRNNKSDLVTQEESSDPVAIRKQVEFYFSDSNLLTDKFLFTKIEGHKNLPVPIEIIHSFKRMRHFQPRSAIVDAIKESTILNVVDDANSIQRKAPLEEGLDGKDMRDIQKVYEDKSMAQSVYTKGFGEEISSTQFDIEAFFQSYGPTNSVRLRRHPDRTFKGSVFVEFDSEETQKKFLSQDPLPKWKGKDLQIKSKKQYCDDKVEDINAGRVRRNSQSRDQRGGFKGKNDDRDWRHRRDEDASEGFPDRKDDDGRDRHHGGKRRGFGSSGRGGGRGRGRGRGGRGRDNDNRRPRSASPTSSARSPPPEPAEEKDTPQVEDAGSKKRAREDDGGEEQGREKKVDVKEG